MTTIATTTTTTATRPALAYLQHLRDKQLSQQQRKQPLSPRRLSPCRRDVPRATTAARRRKTTQGNSLWQQQQQPQQQQHRAQPQPQPPLTAMRTSPTKSRHVLPNKLPPTSPPPPPPPPLMTSPTGETATTTATYVSSSSEESRSTIFKQPNHQMLVPYQSPSNDSLASDYHDDDSLALLEQLIEETSERWQHSSRLDPQRRGSSKSASTSATSNRTSATAPTPRTSHKSTAASPEAAAAAMIRQQQDEIQRLTTLLQQRQQDDDFFEEPSVVPDTEQIDFVPLENIEIVGGGGCDSDSVASGLTNLNDVSTRFGMDSVVEAAVRRPDAASVGPAGLPPTHSNNNNNNNNKTTMVTDHAVSLTAADGRMRQAHYTGPFKNGHAHGTGRLVFENGDVYQGQVVKSQLHGIGTFTFAKSKQPALHGTFCHNVYMG